jgi:hypothetical protein
MLRASGWTSFSAVKRGFGSAPCPHRVVAHVLHAAGDDDVVGTEGDAARRRCYCRHGTGAHAVHGKAGNGAGEAGKQGGAPADGQALVSSLGGGGNGDLVDALGREGRIAAQQLADALDHQVVGPAAGVDALVTRLAERGADAVDEDDVAQGAGRQGRIHRGSSGRQRDAPHVTHG